MKIEELGIVQLGKMFVSNFQDQMLTAPVIDSARWFPDTYAKPIAPTLKRWRRLRRLLMQEGQSED